MGGKSEARLAGIEPAAYGLGNRRHDCVTTKDTKELRELASGEVPTMVPCPLHQNTSLGSSTAGDLAQVIAAWDRLPQPIRTGILAMVQAAEGSTDG